MTIARYLAAVAILLGGSLHASAQQSLDDIEAAIGGAASDLQRVDAMLSNPDPNQRLPAMQMLLASGNAIWVKRAKEVGLFSTDPQMQQAVVHAILDAGGPFRVEFDISKADEKATRIREWIKSVGGSSDDRAGTGEITVLVQPYSTEYKCWLFVNSSNCAFYPTGDVYTVDDWQNAGGSVRLGPDGALSGSVLVDYSRVVEAVPVRIPLAE